MQYFSRLFYYSMVLCLLLISSGTGAKNSISENNGTPAKLFPQTIHIEYLEAGKPDNKVLELPVYKVSESENIRITVYRNDSCQVVINELDRGFYTEINGELEHLTKANSCVTLRISIPFSGDKWRWLRGLDRSEQMNPDVVYFDTISVSTVLPPDGAFNGKNLTDGGYGDPVGQGTMSYYPLCAVRIDDKGKGLGIDMSSPVVYRLGADTHKGLIAEFDLATSPLTQKFPNRAFFKLSQFDFNPEF